jgi:hypothetical protein
MKLSVVGSRIILWLDVDKHANLRSVRSVEDEQIVAQKTRSSLPVETSTLERGTNWQRLALVLHEQIAIRRPDLQLDPIKFLHVNGVHTSLIGSDLRWFPVAVEVASDRHHAICC